jgi:hypothetical protein
LCLPLSLLRVRLVLNGLSKGQFLTDQTLVVYRKSSLFGVYAFLKQFKI